MLNKRILTSSRICETFRLSELRKITVYPEGASKNPDIFQEHQKILIGFYNGGL